MPTYPVKYINSAMPRAPVLTGEYGRLTTLLDAFLITGFGAITPLSIVVAGGIATVTVNSGDTFADYAIVSVSGATPAELNGEQCVLPGATATQFAFKTAAADGTASGVVSIRYAPVGQWESVYTGTNKRVYRSTDLAGSRLYYRVDDSAGAPSPMPRRAHLRGYEQMSDVDTGAAPLPVASQLSCLYKSFNDGTSPVAWDLFGDSRAVLLALSTVSNANGTPLTQWLRGFGDPVPLAPIGDPYAAFVSSAAADTQNFYWGRLDSGSSNSANGGGTYVARPMGAAAAGSVACDLRPQTGTAGGVSGNDAYLGPLAGATDGLLRLAPVYMLASDGSPRARIPGVRYMPQNGALAAGLTARTVAPDYNSDRRFVALGTNAASSYIDPSPTGVYFVDATGPWR